MAVTLTDIRRLIKSY